MKTLNGFLNELAPIGKLKRPNPVVATDSTIKQLVEEGIKKYGNEADLNYIDTSEVTNMESLFSMTDFNGYISDWVVSNVTNMSYMFYKCENFNKPLNNGNVEKVTHMTFMFAGCKKFKGDLNDGTVTITAAIKMLGVFSGCPLKKNPPNGYLT